MTRRGMFQDKIVESVAKIAAGMISASNFNSSVLASHVVEAIRLVGERLKPTGNTIYCDLCGRGPFTRKGYYLHLVRVHYHEILLLVQEESERVGRASRL